MDAKARCVMTLVESKMAKKMIIDASVTGYIPLTDLWFKICLFKKLNVSGAMGEYTITYDGDFNEGLYVLGKLVETIRNANADCHIEISGYYGD